MRRGYLFLLSLTVFTSSCAVYSPKAPLPAKVLSSPYIADLSGPMLLARYDAMPEGPAKIARRNQIIWEIVWLTDESYRTYETSFFSGAAYLNTAGDLISMGLDSVAAVTGTAELKAILAAVGGGIVGARVSYQKNFYDQATRETIVQVMRAARLTKLSEIETGMASGSSYTIEQGLLDATDYYDAGTVTGALIAISEGSSQQMVTARQAMRSTRLAVGATNEFSSDRVSAVFNNYGFYLDYKSMSFSWMVGDVAPGTLTLYVAATSPDPRAFTVTVPSWMFATPNGVTPQGIVVGVKTAQITAADTLVGNLTLTSNSLPTMSIPVTFTITEEFVAKGKK